MEFARIDPQTMQDVKREVGLGSGREGNLFDAFFVNFATILTSIQRRIIQYHHQRAAGMAHTLVFMQVILTQLDLTGPSNQAMNARSQPQQQHGQMQRGKRSSASPGDEVIHSTCPSFRLVKSQH